MPLIPRSRKDQLMKRPGTVSENRPGMISTEGPSRIPIFAFSLWSLNKECLRQNPPKKTGADLVTPLTNTPEGSTSLLPKKSDSVTKDKDREVVVVKTMTNF